LFSRRNTLHALAIGSFAHQGVIYNKQQLAVFFKQQNLIHVYNRYDNGCRLFTSGIILTGIGGVLLITGAALEINIAAYGYYDEVLLRTPGIILCSIGGIIEMIGIPMAITGCVRKHKTINDYNNFIVNHTRYNNVTYRVGILGNRIGLAFNF